MNPGSDVFPGLRPVVNLAAQGSKTMRTANGLGFFAALGLVVTPVFGDDSTTERDFLPTRSGQPSTLWSGVAPMASSTIASSGTSEDRVGAGSGEPGQAPAAGEQPEARDQLDFLPTRSGQPSTFWSGVAPSASSVIASGDTLSGTGQDRVGAGSGEPVQESTASEQTEARDFLPTRSGRPSTFWTGSR